MQMSEAPLTLNTNGGWCWYQDPRVIVDSRTGAVLFASIASGGGAGGGRRAGNVEVTAFDPATGRLRTVAVGRFPSGEGMGDDHDTAALWQRPDGRYLVVYTAHNHGYHEKRPQTFYRISTDPHDASEWQPERAFDWPTDDPVGNGWIAVTYSNLHHLSAEGGGKGRLYNIARAPGQSWRIATSDDWGETWACRGILTLPPEGGRAYSNGYPKFADNGCDRIDFLITEAHPRDYNNGIYHGFIQGGKTFDSAGNVIDPDTFSDTAPLPEQFTAVFKPEAPAQGAYHTGWTTELVRGSDGGLHALFTCRVGVESGEFRPPTTNLPGNADHRLFYARLDGETWRTTELARMGHGLYGFEEDYTGLGAIDPHDPRTVVISTPFDPRDGRQLARHQLFRGRTDDAGATWHWSALTENAIADNLRPRVAPLNDGRRLLLWLHGTYRTMHDYDQAVLGHILD
jgi:hypothetical protein